MPYTREHKQETRERIVECARQLFNRKGFNDVSIDEIMGEAGLTRGGFYNHFGAKEDLFVEAVLAYTRCNPTDRWEDVELDFSNSGPKLARQMINAYLSKRHLDDLNGHCPMIALPSDVARSSPKVKAAYASLIEAMGAIFEGAASESGYEDSRKQALGMVALCVGGMVLARTLEDQELANEVREAARDMALGNTSETRQQ